MANALLTRGLNLLQRRGVESGEREKYTHGHRALKPSLFRGKNKQIFLYRRLSPAIRLSRFCFNFSSGWGESPYSPVNRSSFPLADFRQHRCATAFSVQRRRSLWAILTTGEGGGERVILTAQLFPRGCTQWLQTLRRFGLQAVGTTTQQTHGNIN
jgi:hypothetical protein